MSHIALREIIQSSSEKVNDIKQKKLLQTRFFNFLLFYFEI